MPAADISRVGEIPLFTPEEGPNPSLVLNWSGDELQYIEKTIEGIKYRKTLAWSGGNLIAISEWIEQ